MIRVMIDYENNAETWWDNGGRELWDRWEYKKDKYNYLNLTEEEAKSFFKTASSIEGWDDPEAPAYARFPLLFVNENGEDVWFDGLEFAVCK